MTNALPGAWNLITDSWNAFTKHWSLTVQYSAWIILAVAVQQIVFFFPEESTSWWTAFVLGLVASIMITVWASIRLYQVVLALESGKTVDVKTTAMAMALFLPFVWVGLLEGVATLGALTLLILPGIYVGVRLNFSKFALLEQGKRGRDALVESWNLTKNKFWAIFGRQLAGGAVFVIGMVVVLLVLMLLLSLAMGGGLETAGESPASMFLFGILQGIVQAAILPLFVVFQVKLYNALKKTV